MSIQFIKRITNWPQPLGRAIKDEDATDYVVQLQKDVSRLTEELASAKENTAYWLGRAEPAEDELKNIALPRITELRKALWYTYGIAYEVANGEPDLIPLRPIRALLEKTK